MNKAICDICKKNSLIPKNNPNNIQVCEKCIDQHLDKEQLEWTDYGLSWCSKCKKAYLFEDYKIIYCFTCLEFYGIETLYCKNCLYEKDGEYYCKDHLESDNEESSES